MTEAEAYEAGRGAWKLGPRADNETFALIAANNPPDRAVLAAIEIESITSADAEGRRSIIGRVLEEGHPVRDAYVGRRDPLDNESRNPVGYIELPEEEQYRLRACACGCGTETTRDFAPGHDQKAIHARIRAHFDGSTLRFIHWMPSASSASPRPALAPCSTTTSASPCCSLPSPRSQSSPQPRCCSTTRANVAPTTPTRPSPGPPPAAQAGPAPPSRRGRTPGAVS
jgi:hypothetical protein